jgi:hypothetical protein
MDKFVGEHVAVIVVHGVADQKRGETATAVAMQLAAEAQGSVQQFDLPILVPHLRPAVTIFRWNPDNLVGRVWKSLRQSVRSDFLDENLGEQPVKNASNRPVFLSSAARKPDEGDAANAGADHGVRFTDYLIAKARSVRPDPSEARHYQAPVRQISTGATQVDVFEMYWADLSRLSGSAPRILTELFTLLFHLSKLGADTVALAAVALQSGNWRAALSWFHRAADWMFSRLIALLSLQLVVCVVLLVPALFIADNLERMPLPASLLGGGAIAIGLVYLGGQNWMTGLVLGAVAGAVLWRTGIREAPNAGIFILLLILSVFLALYEKLLVFIEERFKATYGIGWLLLGVTIGSMLLGAATGSVDGAAEQAVENATRQAADGAARHMVAGALRAIEVILLAYVFAWAVTAVLIAGAVVCGEAASIGKGSTATVRQSIVTARLGLFVSLGTFLAIMMSVWALLAEPLQNLVSAFQYRPWWFKSPVLEVINAACFLEQRFANSTENFAVVAVLLLALTGFVVLVFLPSLLREVRLVNTLSAARLGHWLTAGYRAIEWLVRWGSWLVVLLVVAAAVSLVNAQLQRSGLQPPEWLLAFGGLINPSHPQSAEWLQRLVFLFAGSAASLIAVGGVAIKWLQRIRAPLDAALDVDNHFREFPRKAIPRVRIFERYAALLEHIVGQGYRRIVIVSHSQGTAITADMLRYLQRRGQLIVGEEKRRQDPLVKLGEKLRAAEIRLLTVGSPLRQLYSLRFPVSYAWVLGTTPPTGPDPMTELAVNSWVNVWGAGDYVGRWLWTSAPCDDLPPLSVSNAAYLPGHTESSPEENDAAYESKSTYRDRCMGADAHTHYFELEQDIVMEELANLVFRAKKK